MTNTQYHKVYRNLNPKTIKAVRQTIKKGFFKKNANEKFNLLNELKKELCNIYNLSQPYLIINHFNDGFYNPSQDIISLSPKLSLITFLHEFKHQLQHKKRKKNNEFIARAWSLSLFHQATPKLFYNAVKKGLIIHIKPDSIN